MNRWSLRNNRLKLETLRELPIILEESTQQYTSNEWKQNRKITSTCNRLDLESRGPWPSLYAQELRGHWSGFCFNKWGQSIRCVLESLWPWNELLHLILNFLNAKSPAATHFETWRSNSFIDLSYWVVYVIISIYCICLFPTNAPSPPDFTK